MNAPGDGDAWKAFFGEGITRSAHQPRGDIEARRRNVKAATAFLLEYFASLPGEARRVKKHARDMAYTLSERSFAFYGKNAGGQIDMHPYAEEPPHIKGVRRNDARIVSRGKTIELWRRHLRREHSTDTAAPIFKGYRARLPFKVRGNARSDWRAALAWWYEELLRNDY
jgi:hypothetical protein